MSSRLDCIPLTLDMPKPHAHCPLHSSNIIWDSQCQAPTLSGGWGGQIFPLPARLTWPNSCRSHDNWHSSSKGKELNTLNNKSQLNFSWWSLVGNCVCQFTPRIEHPRARSQVTPPKMTTRLRLILILLTPPTLRVRGHCFGMQSYTPFQKHTNQVTLDLH